MVIFEAEKYMMHKLSISCLQQGTVYLKDIQNARMESWLQFLMLRGQIQSEWSEKEMQIVGYQLVAMKILIIEAFSVMLAFLFLNQIVVYGLGLCLFLRLFFDWFPNLNLLFHEGRESMLVYLH
jgi:hypothetical protein